MFWSQTQLNDALIFSDYVIQCIWQTRTNFYLTDQKIFLFDRPEQTFVIILIRNYTVLCVHDHPNRIRDFILLILQKVSFMEEV